MELRFKPSDTVVIMLSGNQYTPILSTWRNRLAQDAYTVKVPSSSLGVDTNIVR
jgi:hypothetical protein